MNKMVTLLISGLMLSMVFMSFSAQATSTVDKPTYDKGDYWVYRMFGIMGTNLDFNITVNKTSIMVGGFDCYETVAKTNSATYSQTTTTWQRKDTLGTVKSYSYSNLQIMTQELTTTYKQGAATEYRYPLKVGDKWNQDVEYTMHQKLSFNGNVTEFNNTIKGKVFVSVMDQESVTVVAGTYDALKVKFVTNLTTNVTQYVWYSYKVGTGVKIQSINNMGTPDPLDDVTQTMELVKFHVRPQQQVLSGGTVHGVGEQLNFLLIIAVVIIVVVLVVVLNIMRSKKVQAGPAPGKQQTVQSMMGVGPQGYAQPQAPQQASYPPQGQTYYNDPNQGYYDQSQVAQNNYK